MKRLIVLLAALALICRPVSAAEGPAVLEIGVLPYLNMEGLLRTYGPLASYLEGELGRPVRIVSARDYPRFVEMTAAKAYPLLVTGSHFARLAQVETGYMPVLRPLTTFREMILVRNDSSIRAVAELKGRAVAVPDRMAQTAMMGRAQLRAHGLDPDRDVTLVEAGSHVNAMLGLANGAFSAAVVSEGGYRHMDEDGRKAVRVLPISAAYAASRTEAIPVIYLVSPDMPRAEGEAIAGLIARFVNGLPDGKAWIEKLGYGGLRPPSAAEMAQQDSYLRELRQVMDPGGTR